MALSFAGSLLSGVGSALLGSVSSSRSAKRAYEYSRALQEHQYELNRNALREYYSNNRYSLVNAGYNPLLALPGSSANGFSASSSMPPTENNMAQDFATGLNAMNSALNAKEQRKLTKAQQANVNADTDIKKYGQKGAILKNLLEFGDKHKDNPVIQKAVEAHVVGASVDNGVSSAISSFKNNHPTTLTVLRKLKQGDFRGAKYAIDLRRKRISQTTNSALSSRPKSYGYDKGFTFEYLPELDELGELPEELAKYHRR